MRNRLLFLAALSALLLAGPLPAADKPADAAKPDPAEKRDLLSDHQTVAKFTGLKFQQCRGLTSLCPDRCGHSGDFADFQIVTYVSYKKTGEYGDEKATTFMFQVDDNFKKLKVSPELAEAARGLKPGDLVRLDWRHEYVTKKEAGGSSSYPERPIVKLGKITPQEAEALAKKAAK